jgi:hypothetical protein
MGGTDDPLLNRGCGLEGQQLLEQRLIQPTAKLGQEFG